MKDTYLYRKLKKTINNNHPILICGIGDNLIRSRHDFIFEQKIVDSDDCSCFCTAHPFTGLPSIVMYTDDPYMKSPSEKIFVLVHEYGHFVSWQHSPDQSSKSADLFRKFDMGQKLTNKQKQLIVEEEQRAWKFGRKFLQDFLPKTDERWKKMELIKRRALRSYKKVLGLI